MRSIFTLLCMAMIVDIAIAQGGYPIATPAQPAWGGYTVPAQIPYQPTLGSDAMTMAAGLPIVTHGLPPGGTLVSPTAPHVEGQAYTLAAPVPLPSDPGAAAGNPVWQTYPQVAAPYGPPPLVIEPPLIPDAPPAGIRPLPRPRDARDGFFQKARFTGTWIPQLDDDSLGWTDLRSEVTVALPFFTRQSPILITPTYELHFLDRPIDLDLPSRLHDLAIDFSHFRRITNDCFVNVAVTPGYYADDHSFDSDDALRINGRAVAIYDPTPEWKWVLGATYVHGGWAKVVPVAGFIYEPSDDVSYELVFPRPRAAWRLPNSPVPGRDEFWFYVLGEFSNLIWAFEQSDGAPDMLASRDFRLILGLERKIIGGLSHRVEVGYVLNREIKLASDGLERDLDDSVLLRAGIVY
jgi:Domain of unknown function (DUF6268)